MGIRVRFAPSPTGRLHVGNIRIAVLNYFFAKRNGGKFVLRIDDTDLERSTNEFENLILEDLAWLGIQWDEFYRQSSNFEKYDRAIDLLKNRIYPCYETNEELDLKRKIQVASGASPVYDRSSLKLSEKERKELESRGITPYWRFRLDDTKTVEWTDLVHGKISIPLNSISDPVLVKPEGSFIYTFASVVDDVDMGITHIIRGDDHITNTAAQIEIFNALSGKCPEFAHIPLLLSFDGQDISKRSGSSLSIINMRNDGIDPQAILCVLSTLGTANNANYSDDMQSLVEKFSFEKISISSPKFNLNDTKILTKKIISEKSFEDVKINLKELGIKNISKEFWDGVKGNLRSIKDALFWEEILFGKINILEVDKNFAEQMLETLKPQLDFDAWIADLKQISKRKGRDLFHPIRVILTGLEDGPELKKIVQLLGYDGIKYRIQANINTYNEKFASV